ncbi:MAG: PQQ-dependent sugar dehydrogenase [Gemmatimonadetes bacterium]|nr:PQQ-dependent sugar dehydrogenase [Gemmatimonadota bacterium]
MSQHLRRTLLALALLPAVARAQGQVLKSSLYDYRVVPVVDGLVNPWSMAFLPNGDMLVTERPGRLRMVRGGKLVEQPISGTPKVAARGQGGLLDVVLHPAFATNRYVYLSYSKALADTGTLTTTAIGRGRLEGDKLVDFTDIFVAETRGTSGHFGSRLAFDRAGLLFITVGDRMAPPSGNLEAHPAQDLSNHHGKVIRLHDDGRVPSDNPFVGRAGARGEIWSYGHRNMQALVIHPVTGDVWLTEHGPQGGDELNLIKKGANYGWPVIGFGVNYGSGSAIHAGTRKDGMENAVHVWVPSIGVSGMTYYTGDKFPEWKGNLLAGGMSGEQLGRFTVDGERAELAETIVRRQGRIRDVRTGPDGYVYLAIEDRSGKPTPIVRLEPVKR